MNVKADHSPSGVRLLECSLSGPAGKQNGMKWIQSTAHNRSHLLKMPCFFLINSFIHLQSLCEWALKETQPPAELMTNPAQSLASNYLLIAKSVTMEDEI